MAQQPDLPNMPKRQKKADNKKTQNRDSSVREELKRYCLEVGGLLKKNPKAAATLVGLVFLIPPSVVVAMHPNYWSLATNNAWQSALGYLDVSWLGGSVQALLWIFGFLHTARKGAKAVKALLLTTGGLIALNVSVFIAIFLWNILLVSPAKIHFETETVLNSKSKEIEEWKKAKDPKTNAAFLSLSKSAEELGMSEKEAKRQALEYERLWHRAITNDAKSSEALREALILIDKDWAYRSNGASLQERLNYSSLHKNTSEMEKYAKSREKVMPFYQLLTIIVEPRLNEVIASNSVICEENPRSITIPPIEYFIPNPRTTNLLKITNCNRVITSMAGWDGRGKYINFSIRSQQSNEVKASFWGPSTLITELSVNGATIGTTNPIANSTNSVSNMRETLELFEKALEDLK